MPIYEYRCEQGHTFEVMQRMTDDPIELCEEHGTPVQRVFHPVAVHFKGSGFYNTDYGKKKKAGATSSDSDSSSSSSSNSDKGKSAASESKSDSSGGDSKKETPKKDESKPATKPASAD